MERLRRSEMALHNATTAAGGRSAVDLEYPWGTLFRWVVADTDYWADHIKEPCLMISARARSADGCVQGDCATAANPSAHVATYGSLGEVDLGGAGQQCNKRSVPPPPDPDAQARCTAKPAASSNPPPVAVAADANLRHTVNRHGNLVCIPFQTGACVGKGLECHKDSKRRHACSICLGPRPSGGSTLCSKSFAGYRQHRVANGKA